MRIRSVAAASLSTALLLGAVVPASAQDDPYQVLTNAVTATATATSFHLLAEANGTLNLGESMGNVPFPIDGTKAEGDVSINPPALSITFEVPIQGLPISGGAIVPGDGNAYVKLALPMGSIDDLWHVMAIGPLNVSSVLASPQPGEDMAAKLKTSLDQAGAVLTNEGDASCTAGTCTKLHLEVPASAFDDTVGDLGGMLGEGSPAPSAAAAAPIPVDILVDNASGRLDSVAVTYADAANGTNISLTVTLSNYDAPI
ncbi:MAG: hypothetical protein U0667_05415, partial [Chloroflexota bacterium]